MILAELGQDQDADASFLRSLEVFEGLIKAHRRRPLSPGLRYILHFLGVVPREHIRHKSPSVLRPRQAPP
jgi:hypothetical protein